MKNVRSACVLQPNALSLKLSDQIEQLDELIHAEGDGTAYFQKTFITQGICRTSSQRASQGWLAFLPKPFST